MGQQRQVIMASSDPLRKGMLHLQIQEFLVVAADEAHSLRKGSTYFPAMLHLQDVSALMLALSATPIYTHPQVSQMIQENFLQYH